MTLFRRPSLNWRPVLGALAAGVALLGLVAWAKQCSLPGGLE